MNVVVSSVVSVKYHPFLSTHTHLSLRYYTVDRGTKKKQKMNSLHIDMPYSKAHDCVSFDANRGGMRPREPKHA